MWEQGVLNNYNPIKWKHHRGLVLKSVNSAQFLKDTTKATHVLFSTKFEGILASHINGEAPILLKDFFKEFILDMQEALVFTAPLSPEMAAERRKLPQFVQNYFKSWFFFTNTPKFMWKFRKQKFEEMEGYV
jgi:hypothetical protein